MLENKYIRDVSKVTRPQAFGIGVVAGLITLGFYYLMRLVGWTGFSPELIWGSFFTYRQDANTRWIGFLLFLTFSGFIALAYSSLFRSARRSGAGIGLSLGFLHWALAGIAMGLLPDRVGSPGFFMMNTSFMTALIFLAAHLTYGSAVGALFDRAAIKFEYPIPITT